MKNMVDDPEHHLHQTASSVRGFFRFWLFSASPVVCVVVSRVGCGVHIISYQPVEVLVTADTDDLHVSLGNVRAVCIEVAEDHHVLQHRTVITDTNLKRSYVSSGPARASKDDSVPQYKNKHQ